MMMIELLSITSEEKKLLSSNEISSNEITKRTVQQTF